MSRYRKKKNQDTKRQAQGQSQTAPSAVEPPRTSGNASALAQATASRTATQLSIKDGFSITDENYASIAEGLMESYMQPSARKAVTTTKLRSIYGLIMSIYVKVTSPQEYEAAKPDIQYLKVRMAYEAGREDSVKDFLKETNLRSLVDGVASYEQFMLYCRFAEALVAYFKFFGGKDK